MKSFLQELYVSLFCDKGTAIVSKTKLGVWVGVAATILLSKEIITPETFQIISAVAAGVLGVGIRDLRKK